MPQDPAEIQRQIEEIRTELAATVEQLAERVSPKAAAARGTDKVKGFFGIGEGETRQELLARVRWPRVAAVGGAVTLLVSLRVRRARRR